MRVKNFWRGTRLWIFGLLVGFYTTFVIQSLWNWFAVPAFHVQEASYWLIYGINMLFHLITESYTLPDEQRWKRAFIFLDACVQEPKRDVLKQQIEEELESEWSETGYFIFG
jgi:hypothetical protein